MTGLGLALGCEGGFALTGSGGVCSGAPFDLDSEVLDFVGAGVSETIIVCEGSVLGTSATGIASRMPQNTR